MLLANRVSASLNGDDKYLVGSELMGVSMEFFMCIWSFENLGLGGLVCYRSLTGFGLSVWVRTCQLIYHRDILQKIACGGRNLKIKVIRIGNWASKRVKFWRPD